MRAILLPGHGTRPGGRVTAEAEQWFPFVRAHARDLAARVERLYLGGDSVGAAIATVVALEGWPRADGLVALAPAWELDGLRTAVRLAREPESVGYAAYRGADRRAADRLTARLTRNPHFDDLVERIAALVGVSSTSAIGGGRVVPGAAPAQAVAWKRSGITPCGRWTAGVSLPSCAARKPVAMA